MRNYKNLFCLIACCSFFLFASFTLPNTPATSATAAQPGIGTTDEAWTLQTEVSGVKVYYQISSCQDASVVYLKFDNTNSGDVRISWKEAFATKQIGAEREGYTGKKQLLLKPGVTAQSDCNQIEVAECIRFAHQLEPTYKADITKFSLKEIAVSNPS